MVSFNRPSLPAVQGHVADGYEPLGAAFEELFAKGLEVGAALTVYVKGERVAHLRGGFADMERRRPWQDDTRIVVFSCTKGLTAMAFALLADRGKFDWDAPVATYWPGFARGGKADVTVRCLLNHRAGLPYLDAKFSLEDFSDPAKEDAIVDALEAQSPVWTPGEDQGYHATTFGMYARELFERIAGEPLGDFLTRELFTPLGADVDLGTPASEDHRIATLYPPSTPFRIGRMALALASEGSTPESRVFRASIAPGSISLRAYLNPKTKGGVHAYNRAPARRSALAWASATATADGLARAYLPFAGGGQADGQRYLAAETIAPVFRRQGWSQCDRVLQKPLGWSQGFLKEQRHLFSPVAESFGHAGLGGALGWCDPVNDVAFGYVLNRLDHHVRSPRAVALCRALYECAPLLP